MFCSIPISKEEQKQFTFIWGFLYGPMEQNVPSSVGDMSPIPGWGTKNPTCQVTSKPEHHNWRRLNAKMKSSMPQLRPDTAK